MPVMQKTQETWVRFLGRKDPLTLSFPPLRVRDTRLSAPQEQGAWPKPRLSEVLKKCVRGKKYPLLSEMVHSCLECSRRAGAA